MLDILRFLARQPRRARTGVLTRGSLFRTRLLATSLLVGNGPPAAAQRPETVPPATALDAYLDETARHLMLGARAARDNRPDGHRFLYRPGARTDEGEHVRLPAQPQVCEWESVTRVGVRHRRRPRKGCRRDPRSHLDCRWTKKSEFDSPILSVLVEALRLANSRHDRVVLRRICREWERLTGVAIEAHAVGAAAALAGGDFLRAWVDVAATAGAGVIQPALHRIRTDLVDGLKFPEIVDWFLEDGWRSWGDDDLIEPSEEEVETWRALHRDIVREYGPGLTLNTYLQRLDLSSKAPPPAPNAVQCITVHRSKGLEFNHVYVIGMAQEVFPSYRALKRGQTSNEVEEERRSCFVAITRTRETLTLTRSREYFGYRKRASQFLREMGVR